MYENQNFNHPKVLGAGFDPRFRADQIAKQQTVSELQMGTAMGCATQSSRTPLGEVADALDQRLQQMQSTIYRLGERLVPVISPATPTAQEVGGSPLATGAPVVDMVAAASTMLWSMQRQLESLIDRLAV